MADHLNRSHQNTIAGIPRKTYEVIVGDPKEPYEWYDRHWWSWVGGEEALLQASKKIEDRLLRPYANLRGTQVSLLRSIASGSRHLVTQSAKIKMSKLVGFKEDDFRINTQDDRVFVLDIKQAFVKCVNFVSPEMKLKDEQRPELILNELKELPDE